MNTQNSFQQALYREFALLALFIITLGAYLLGIIPEVSRLWVLGVVVLLGFLPVATSAWDSIIEKKINVDLLATIALFFAFIAHEWGSVLFINMMLTSARILGLYAERRVDASLKSLIKLKPLWARILRDEGTVDVPLAEVQKGDLVLVNLGEQIPVDGTIMEGSATVDQSSLTGESLPALKTEGDPVFSATTVASGNLMVRAEHVGAETIFERMIKLVEASQAAKTRMKTIAERFASWYIGIMLVVSGVLYVATGNEALVLAVVLVVCADDIAIAIPLAYVAAIGTAARRGILVKSADFLDQAARMTTLIVDKTGTLTMGRLSVGEARTFGVTHDRMFELAGALASRSAHPVSKAIMRHIQDHGCPCGTPDTIKEIEGRGIYGTIEGGEIIMGRPVFLEEHGVTIPHEVSQAVQEEGLRGNNATLIAYRGEVIGLFALADEVRPGVKETVAALKKSGIKETIMLTGDNAGVAKIIAEDTGIEKYYPGLLPEHKVAILEKYLGHGRTVAMVGDGVNDAAVLTRSDLGIAMGGIGTSAAIDSADVVLMQDEFPKILELRTIAQKVLAVAYSNFTIWAIVNTIGLYLVFTGVLGPSGAAAYNFLTDFIPIGNALRLYYYRPRHV